jgi:curved DNA-binding protein CbpA
MNTSAIVEALDSEINRLQEVRNTLTGLFEPKRRGRPRSGSVARGTTVKQRTMSAAGRNRIAEAQRKRWAKQKAESTKAAKKTAAKSLPSKAAKKNAAKKATKRPAHKVTVSKIPAKKRLERKPRVPKKGPAKHSVSGASETLVSPKASQE